MPVTLEDSNGSHATLWKGGWITKDELKEGFFGATGGLRKKKDNSLQAAHNGSYKLEDGETYVVVVPPST
jgi:hypothetical protein